MVPMLARCSSMRWRRSQAEPGCLSCSSASRAASFARRLAAAARVKVTMSNLSAGTGSLSRTSRRAARSTSTAVLPLPAAALTSRAEPSWSMAARWSFVNCMFPSPFHSCRRQTFR